MNLPGKLLRHLKKIWQGDAAAGLLLIVMAAAAMAAANSRWAGQYHLLLRATLPGPIPLLPNIQAWIDEGLMAVFFFSVGLEIKREALIGELASPARRRLPILAAAAGMAMPALIYLAFTWGDLRLARGWAIPTATDIAFAVGVLGLAVRRLPASLRLFLLGVAVVDDLGAVTIIALAYSAHLDPAWLAASGAVLGMLILVNLWGYRQVWGYLALSLVLWVCVLHSGIHPSVAGVAAALTVPLRSNGLKTRSNGLKTRSNGLKSRSNNFKAHGVPSSGPLLRLEHALSPWCSWLILPLFALANAGVGLTGGGGWRHLLLQPLPIAVGAGLMLGKQLGIFGAVAAAERLGLARRPHGASWVQLWGVSVLAGIGFTMSLFIAALAFPAAPDLAEAAKLGVLAGSLVSAMLGYMILHLAAPRP
jgi:NhaA family Na+:H+ antiporter